MATPSSTSILHSALRAARANYGNNSPVASRVASVVAFSRSADASLCLLSQSITAALDSLSEGIDVDQAKLGAMRAELHAAVDSRCDVLGAAIAAAKTAKAAALERERCAVDAVLERSRCDWNVAAKAAESADLTAQHIALQDRLDVVESMLSTLPANLIEPPFMGLFVDAPRLLAEIGVFGVVAAPVAVTAADLTPDESTSPLCAVPGVPLLLRFALAPKNHTSQSTDELEVSLSAAAAAMHVDVTMESWVAAPQPLECSVTSYVRGRCLTLACTVPVSAPTGGMIYLAAATVSGQPVCGLSRLCVPVRRPLRTPLRFAWSRQHAHGHNAGIPLQTPAQSGLVDRGTPCSVVVSAAGQLFVPQYGNSELLVCDSDGTQIAGIPVADLGLSQSVCWAAYAEGDSPSLLLADTDKSASRLVAVDPVLRTLRWATAPGSLRGCLGVAALLESGTVVVASPFDTALNAYRLSDGEKTSSLVVPGLGRYLAADTALGTIYGNIQTSTGKRALFRCSWVYGAGLVVEECATPGELGDVDYDRPLAVVPPAPGKQVAHLVVCNAGTSLLHVFALPGLVRVHSHQLFGMRVHALAADHLGGVLAISDFSSQAVHALRWPLPGMPELE